MWAQRTGDVAYLRNLEKRSDLNNYEVELLEWDDAAGRWRCRLIGTPSKTLLIKPRNLHAHPQLKVWITPMPPVPLILEAAAALKKKPLPMDINPDRTAQLLARSASISGDGVEQELEKHRAEIVNFMLQNVKVQDEEDEED